MNERIDKLVERVELLEKQMHQVIEWARHHYVDVELKEKVKA